MGKLFDELKELKAAYDKKIKDDGEAALGEAFKEVFDKFPDLKAITWVQYTPYFNDGDTCTFSVHDFDVNFNDEDYNYGDTLWELRNDPSKKELIEAIRTLRQELPSDVLEYIFGDHAKIVATPTGFKVTEFNHD